MAGCGDGGGATSPPANRAPQAAGAIPDHTVDVGETTALDVSAHFSDPDGDALSYEASSSDATVAAVSVSGSTVTISAASQGTATITVTATDPGGLTATQSFGVTVPNRPPEPVGAIPDHTIQVGEAAALDVSAHFTDPDGDALSYGASSSDPAVAAVSVSGSTVTMTSLATGTATITVTATDPRGLTATQSFGVTVPNRPPEPVGAIPDNTVHIGETAALDVSVHFTDPDGDALIHGASSSDPAVAAVSVSGSTVTISAASQGTATIAVTATDPGGLTATQSFGVTVPNRPPEPVGAIPDHSIHVGETTALDVSAHFSDPDGDALSYEASSSDATVAAVSLSGSTVTMTSLATGTATITITASDPGGLSATQSFVATVPNRPPEPVGAIPDHTIHVGETAALDVSAHFTDPDGDALSHGASSSDPAVAAVSVSGSTVRVSAASRGTATIAVTATDPGGLTATHSFAVTVTTPAPDLAFTEDSPMTATVAPGASVTFTFRIRNRGGVSSAATTIRAVRSANSIISTRDAEIASHPFAVLGAGEERAFPLTISVDARSAAGTIYIGMCIDAVPNESNARNNCSDGARLTVAAPSTGQGRVAGQQSSIRIRAQLKDRKK